MITCDQCGEEYCLGDKHTCDWLDLDGGYEEGAYPV